MALNPSKVHFREKPVSVVLSRANYLWFGFFGLIVLAVAILAVVYFSDLGAQWGLYDLLSSQFFIFMLGGFIAQMIDGALGMAYGVSASSFLLTVGVSPAAASASIHASEIFTSGVSGLMHLKFQNVNKKLFQTLLLPGVVGAILGAYLLSELENYNHILRPIVATYTLCLGVIIIIKAIRKAGAKIKTKRIPLLATFGGLMDSVGGGGWGPIVSSTLIAGGRCARYTVGSVNLAEFFVAVSSSLTFIVLIGLSHFQIILGLIAGGIIAAPIAASITRKLPTKTMMIIVGITVVLVSFRLIAKSLYNI